MGIPSGTVSFLFTDIVGSTRLWETEPERMRQALRLHDQILRRAIESAGGYVFKTVGDAFCAAFAGPSVAVAAAQAAQTALCEPRHEGFLPRVRMGLHLGMADEREGDYFGPAVNRTARLMSLGHGGQILLSLAVAELCRDALPPGVSLKELGQHRLKDLQRPEQVFQLEAPELPRDFPPLQSLDRWPNNLPAQLSSFVGRQEALSQLRRQVLAQRLVSLCGPGGAGKTRLAIQTGGELLDQFPDGVWFVDLAPLADGELLPRALIDALRIDEQAGKPLLDTFVERMAPARFLLILDNCEHLVAAVAHCVAGLLNRLPRLSVLATSREALGLAGESLVTITSLSAPEAERVPALSPDALLGYEAVRLFVERAQAAAPGFRLESGNAQAVAEICRRLDGMPLALELAAARVRMLSVEQIASRLADRFRLLAGGGRELLPRQQTLRATIDWGHELLSLEEKRLLRRLAVFAGGWSLEAAEGVVADGELAPGLVLDLLSRLVDKSFVVADTAQDLPRYRFLETLRDYARARAEEAGEWQPLRRRHLEHFIAHAEQGAGQREHAAQLSWLKRMAAELDNLRTALVCADEAQDADSLLRLCAALYPFWEVRGYVGEGSAWLARALALEGGAEVWRMHAQLAACRLAYRRKDYEASRDFGEAGLKLARRLQDKECIALALNRLGVAAVCLQHMDVAKQLLEKSVQLARAGGQLAVLALSLNSLGEVARSEGQWDQARRCYAEALDTNRLIGDRLKQVDQMVNLGLIAQAFERWPEAAAHFDQALRICAELDDKAGIAYCLEGLAGARWVAQEPARAARLLGHAAALRQLIDESIQELDRPSYEATLARLEQALADQARGVAWDEGRHLSTADAVGLALA
ncbi:MAG: tetratricopeptide repeat protein [Gammaproteobacteria bacterium]|nr:tetratricopeptide repeat protein [Gammaproteobacteria bacterium]